MALRFMGSDKNTANIAFRSWFQFYFKVDNIIKGTGRHETNFYRSFSSSDKWFGRKTNGTLAQTISFIVAKNLRNWDNYIKSAVLSYGTAPSATPV